jgi:hypothetical protein
MFCIGNETRVYYLGPATFPEEDISFSIELYSHLLSGTSYIQRI